MIVLVILVITAILAFPVVLLIANQGSNKQREKNGG